MYSVVAGFAPIWVLTGIGYLARRTSLFTKDAEDALTRVVFYLAMPLALFTTLARTEVDALPTWSALAFVTSTVLTGALGLAASRVLFQRRLADQAVAAMSSAYVNAANLGLPIAVIVLGDPAFAVVPLLFQLLIVTPTVLTLIDADLATGTNPCRRVLMLPIRNPVILGAAAGLLSAALDLTLPQQLAQPLDMLGATAVPLALLALGSSLADRAETSLNSSPIEVAVVAILKTGIQPVICYLVGSTVFGMQGHMLLAAVAFAALPTAQNAFIFASRYRLDAAGLARDAVLVTTPLSMVVLTAVVYLLAPV